MAASEVYDFKSVGVKRNDPRFIRDVELKPVGIVTPLALETNASGPFKMSFTLSEQIHDNFKNLILTNHGDRLGRYTFGANLKELCTELSSIKSAVAQSMPYLELSTFESTFNVDPETAPKPPGMALLSIKIIYSVPKLRIGNKAIEVVLFISG